MEMVNLLCECGVKPAILQFSVLKSDQNNDTLWSDRNNQLLSLLLELGADPDSFIYNKPSGYPLVSAAAEGEVRAVELLLRANARTDLPIPEFGTALQAAAAPGHEAVVRLLVEAGANVNAICDITESHHMPLRFSAAFMTPIQLAARGNSGDIVQILIQSGALVNHLPIIPHLGLRAIEEMFSNLSRWGYSDAIPLAYPIQHAAVNNNMALVQQLLAAGAHVDSRVGTNYGDTPLQIAARIGNIGMAEMLLSYNADVNAPPGKYDGRTAIQAAAGNGNMDMMQMLISAGADINAAAGWRKGRTAIQAAMEEGHHDLIALLLRLGADINARPAFSGGLTALQAAAASGHIELLKAALSNGADVKGAVSPENGVTALQAAINRKDISALNVMLRAGVDVNELLPSKASDPLPFFDDMLGSNMTSLQLAACFRWIEGAKLLIDSGAEVDILPPQPDIYALTALGWAIDNYDHDMMELLLQSGADPNAPSMNYEEAPSAFLYALHQCCSNEMFDFFLQRGADITKCWGSQSAIEVAISSTTNDISIVRKVIEVSSQLAGWSDSTVMQKALACITVDKDYPPDADLVKTLLDAGANVNAIDIDTGETLLQKTLIEPDVDVVKLLLESGAKVNFPATEDKGTPLQTAIFYGEPEIANLLIDFGADVNALPAEKKGATALQAAAIHGYIGLARRLLEHGADVAAAAAPVDGRTAIDGAAEHGRLDMLQLLLNSYPSREDLPLACNRAATFAEKEGHIRVAAWLRAYASC
ncbi:ankyrin repeat-containing domain protein [Aspergillus falconensis]